LPGWQRWYTQQRPADLELLSVAVDLEGEEAVRRWTERAGATFPTVLDAENRLGALLGYKVIPNGVLLDPEGVIRYAKLGGFEVNRPEDLAAVEAAMRSHAHPVAGGRTGKDLSAEEQARVAALLREGTAMLQTGRGEAGLAAWREALRLDPDNFVIRKQLWRADHPDRFGETIDFEWQRGQLAVEKEREARQRS
jgi:hypothetical protein